MSASYRHVSLYAAWLRLQTTREIYSVFGNNIYGNLVIRKPLKFEILPSFSFYFYTSLVHWPSITSHYALRHILWVRIPGLFKDLYPIGYLRYLCIRGYFQNSKWVTAISNKHETWKNTWLLIFCTLKQKIFGINHL